MKPLIKITQETIPDFFAEIGNLLSRMKLEKVELQKKLRDEQSTPTIESIANVMERIHGLTVKIEVASLFMPTPQARMSDITPETIAHFWTIKAVSYSLKDSLPTSINNYARLMILDEIRQLIFQNPRE
jgi:hypothetical protein